VGGARDGSRISLVIPTLDAADVLPELLQRVMSQKVRPDELLVVDSDSDDDTVEIANGCGACQVMTVRRKDFNHGLTRHAALLRTTGDFVLFLTQDAMPCDESYVAHLLEPFRDDAVAMSSGRQIPRDDASRYEQLVRAFNYPPVSNVRSAADVERLGIKAFFASDACSAYRRSAYLECGGFRPCATNEDMLMAATFIRGGWKVAYAADARVIHSHNLTFAEEYRRNKVVASTIAQNDDLLGGVSASSEGKRMVRQISGMLVRERRFGQLCAFGIDCAARFLGNRAGGNL
jgi:rhamnosyltransferase